MTVSKSNERDQDLAALRTLLGMARTACRLEPTGIALVDVLTQNCAEEYVTAIEDCISIIEALIES